MSEYLPLLAVVLVLKLALVTIFWPWLKGKSTREKALTAGFVTLCLALALYLVEGSPFSVSAIIGVQQTQGEWRAQLAALQAHQPKTAQNWAKMGETYIRLEDYPHAVVALKQAVIASGGSPQLIFLYGKAQMAAADGVITEDAKQAFDMAARLMPDNPIPSFYLALERMENGDMKGAKLLFQKILPRLPKNSPMRRMVMMQLEKSEK